MQCAHASSQGFWVKRVSPTHLVTPSPAHQHSSKLHIAGELQTASKTQGLLQVLFTGLGDPCKGRGLRPCSRLAMEEKVPLTPVMSWGIGLVPILLPEKSALSKGQSFTKIRTSSRIQTHISWGYNLSCPRICVDLEKPMLLSCGYATHSQMTQ